MDDVELMHFMAELEIDEKKLEDMRNGGGEVVEASDDCESGACKI